MINRSEWIGREIAVYSSDPVKIIATDPPPPVRPDPGMRRSRCSAPTWRGSRSEIRRWCA
jgi:hypothetical protein